MVSFIVCTLKSYHTIVLYENTYYYEKLLDMLGKTIYTFVSQPFLLPFLLKNWSYG